MHKQDKVCSMKAMNISVNYGMQHLNLCICKKNILLQKKYPAGKKVKYNKSIYTAAKNILVQELPNKGMREQAKYSPAKNHLSKKKNNWHIAHTFSCNQEHAKMSSIKCANKPPCALLTT